MTPKKYPQNLHTPKNIYFYENPKNIEIRNFEPKKMTWAYVCTKISENPPLGGLHKPVYQVGQPQIILILWYLSLVLMKYGMTFNVNHLPVSFNNYEKIKCNFQLGMGAQPSAAG